MYLCFINHGKKQKTDPMYCTTYPTIHSAFKNGNGDVFFANPERTQFFTISRHDGVNEIPGFERLSYSETVTLAETQKPTSAPAPQPVGPAPGLLAIKASKMVDNSHISNFYDEYPDAYGQSL